jgi:hypothetical protein
MIRQDEARKLCSKSEWTLLESSFSPLVETLPPSDLKTRIKRIRKLHQKSEAAVELQHSDDRKQTTRRKIELFAEANARLEAALAFLEKAHRVAPISKTGDSEKLAEQTRTSNLKALQERADAERESREKHVLSAIAVRGEQQASKSGARRVQSHVGSATRRQQGRRDSKNR